MNIEKKVLADMDRCYSVAQMELKGEPGVYFASEGKGGSCVAFPLRDLTEKTTVWEQPGGTMGMVPIPGKPEEFLAGQKFFRLYQWEEAQIVWVRPQEDGTFQCVPILQLPYLHRFDILVRGGRSYLIACTLAAHKETREDWRCPGAVYTAPLPETPEEPLALSIQLGGLYQNHGYQRGRWKDAQVGFVSGEQGVFVLTPPEDENTRWQVEKIMDRPVSDIALTDIDGDGQLELATIEPFHGKYFRVYRPKDGGWEMIYQHPEISEFYHVATSGSIGGKPVFLGGCRREKQQLFYLSWEQYPQGHLELTVVDEGVGPSNAIIVNLPGEDLIFSANREVAQAVVYRLQGSKEE